MSKNTYWYLLTRPDDVIESSAQRHYFKNELNGIFIYYYL